MLDLNSMNKEDAILIIKDLFSEMCSSRRQLKPILSEILRAIDNNVFIDANSEERKQLYVTGGTLVAIGGLESGGS